MRGLNPYTVAKLVETWRNKKISYNTPLYILEIAAAARCWPATIYRAEKLGYLHKSHTAHFNPTLYCLSEYKEILRRRKTRFLNTGT